MDRHNSNETQPHQRHAPAHKSLGRFWIGLAILAAMGLMAMSAWRQGWFTSTEYIYVSLDNGAQGVQVGTLVKLKGFKIGEVDEMNLEPNLNVRIRMRVASEKLALLHEDAQVKLTRDTPISAKYIEFLAGSKEKAMLQADKKVSLHTGGDVEDVMLIVKGAVEKLNSALGKVEPILDDVKKLSSEAADMRKTVHNSVDVMLANLQALTQQLKQIGNTANTMASGVDADRAVIMAQIKDIVKTLDATLSKDVPKMSAQVQAVLAEANNAAMDLPPVLRSTRSLTQDVAEITDGAKKTWPISSMVKGEAAAKPLALDAFEAAK